MPDPSQSSPLGVPPPPPPRAPEVDPGARGARSTPWTGRDLAITVLGGGGLGLLLSTAVLVPLLATRADVSPPTQLALVSVILYGSLCAFGWWFAIKRHGATLADAGFRWAGIGPLLLMIPAAIVLMLVNGALLFVTDMLFGNVPTAQDQVLAGQDTLSSRDFLYLLVAGAVVAPFAEEFLFRGLLYRYVRARRTILVATLVSAVVFAFAHFIWILIPSYIVFGIAEAVVAERYDSLYPAVALHGLNNGVLFLALFATLNP